MAVVATGVATNISTEIAKTGLSFSTTQVSYIINCNEILNGLQNAISKLRLQKDDLMMSINARGEDKRVTCRTERWLLDVANLEERINKMEKYEGKTGKIHLVNRLNLGKKSEKLKAEIDKLMEERKELIVFHPPVVSSFSSRPTKGFKDYISVRGVLDDVIDALKDEKKYILAIYGMGGIGKTTLIDEIGRKVEGVVFDVVILVEVRQNEGEAEIQDYIFEQLGMKFKANSLGQRSGELASTLRRQGSVLIMLDNLWTDVNLGKIGIPHGADHKGCKILLTTRKIEVCNQMCTDAHFSVKLLSEEDSWDLFKSKVGEVVTKTEIESIAKKVACECANLPLALVVVGTALRGTSERDIWGNALRQLRESKPKNLTNLEEKVFKCLEWSYNNLRRDDLKLLFLLCSLFPEGYDLSEDELTRLGIWEDKIESFNNLELARDNMHILVSKLIDSCLLMRTKKNKVTKIHDVLRDVAIYIASREKNGFFIESDYGTVELLEEKYFLQSKRISLINSKISQLPNNPKAPKLKVLLVRNNTKLISLPDNFFKYMEVLTVLDLSDSTIVLLPSSLRHVKNLRVFSLNRCVKLCRISIIGKLENLQILSWQNCPMEFLPKEIKKLTKLKLLDLSNSHELKLLSTIFCKLRFLEELYLDSNCLNETVLIEITNLKKLSSLQLYVTDYFFCEDSPMNTLKKLGSYVLYNNHLFIKKARIYKKNLYIKGAQYLAEWVKLLLEEVEDLSFNNCFENADPLFEWVGLETKTRFSKLKILRISNCQCTEYIIRKIGNSTPEDGFVQLEELYLSTSHKLKGISEGPLSELSFGRTRKINITACRSMISVIPYGVTHLHHNLEELKVRDCKELQGVFYFNQNETNVVTLDSLQALYLHDLPKLGAICHNQVPKGSFGNLTDLHMQGCNELKYLFSASVITGFQCLEKIIVSDNANMEEIILDDVFILDEFALPKLMELELVSLPKLNHFYKLETAIKIFAWPLLKNVKLGICRNLKMLPIGLESAPKLKKIELVERNDEDWYKRLVWDDAATSKRFETLVSG